ncbi:MAG: hypothetical protein NC453_21300 [Muribaculum sp.]|nr:hypothetical protein [Muribaculum sp.]
MIQFKKFLILFVSIIPLSVIAQTNGTENGHTWVDLGLSVKWATCNIGASKPSDFGIFLAWGETSPKSSYNYRNSSTFRTSQSNISGTSKDAAKSNWGGNWRMPKLEEIKELMESCTWDWASVNGHNGYQITGPNGNQIFLPASGAKSDDKLFDQGTFGCYWSGTTKDSEEAYSINFDPNDYGWSSDAKFGGVTIRAVLP